MKEKENALALPVALLSLALIVVNVVLLFGRYLVANLVATMVLTALTAWLLPSRREAGTTGVEAAKQETSNQKSSSTTASPTLHFWQRLSSAGAYLLLLGLCLESYEGGIRKDDVTLSYLFVTCGLAFYALLLLTVVCDHWHVRWLCAPLEMVGKNPMVAYVSASMVIIPVLILTHIYPYIDALSSQPLTGFLKGVLLTALCMALTAWFTHKRWFWKT